ncbi:unnamed protein product, partial [Menidia menidia]
MVLQVSMMAVDDMYGDVPMIERDRYWNDSNPRPPYTAATLFPLEDIAENMEESGSHHPNMALFNRLLNAAPSPSGFMGGALRRTSAQLQRLYHSPSIDRCPSDEEEEEEEGCKVGKGGSLPSGLGQDTQSTVCSFRDERSPKTPKTPLLEIRFSEEPDGNRNPPEIQTRGE